MGRNGRDKGFTLMEMVVVIAILAILAAIVGLFYFRYLDRVKAAINAANLRAARSRLVAELEIDPDHPDEVIDRVISGAPDALEIDVPGMQIPGGTPMEAVPGDDGMDTVYDGYNAEDLDDLFGDKDPEEETKTSYCPVASCVSTDLMEDGYCGDHQMKTCQKSQRDGDALVPCGAGYREVCSEAHYKSGLCNCKAAGGWNNACRNCGHYHDSGYCYTTVLVPDNDT